MGTADAVPDAHKAMAAPSMKLFFFFYYSLAHGGESAVSLDSFIHTIVVGAVGIQKGDPVPDASHDFAA